MSSVVSTIALCFGFYFSLSQVGWSRSTFATPAFAPPIPLPTAAVAATPIVGGGISEPPPAGILFLRVEEGRKMSTPTANANAASRTLGESELQACSSSSRIGARRSLEVGGEASNATGGVCAFSWRQPQRRERGVVLDSIKAPATGAAAAAIATAVTGDRRIGWVRRKYIYWIASVRGSC